MPAPSLKSASDKKRVFVLCNGCVSMMNPEIHEKIENLLEIYKLNWGKQLDLLDRPAEMTQDELAEVLVRIVETGESLLVGWEKCRRR